MSNNTNEPMAQERSWAMGSLVLLLIVLSVLRG